MSERPQRGHSEEELATAELKVKAQVEQLMMGLEIRGVLDGANAYMEDIGLRSLYYHTSTV